MEFLCRTCLNISETRCNIFDSFKDEKLISESLMELAPVKIQKCDAFPYNICKSCLQKLTFAYDFKLMIIESDTKLQNGVHGSILENKRLVQPHRSDEIFFLKQEIEDIKTDQVEYSTCGNIDKNATRDTTYIDCESTEIKDENMSGEGNPDSQKKCLTEIEELDLESSDLIRTTFETNIAENNQDTTYQSLGIKEEHTSKEENCDYDMNRSTNTVSILKSTISTTETYQVNANNEIPTKNNLTDPVTIQHGKSFGNKMKLNLLDNPDCKTIMESYLSPAQKLHQKVTCRMCNCTYTFRDYYNKHICHVNPSSKDDLLKSDQIQYTYETSECNPCKKLFKHRQELNNHLLVHKKDKQFVCKICRKTFALLSDWQQHTLLHNDFKSYSCRLCGKKYKYRSNLLQHMREH